MKPLTLVAADTFKVDPVHSSVVFSVQHLGVINFYGRFNDIIRAAAVPLSLVCAGLWLSGFFYAELPAASALLLALAPAPALLPVGKESHSQWRVLAYRIAFVAVPVAIAVVLALHASPPLE
jgi:hypothetical protein